MSTRAQRHAAIERMNDRHFYGLVERFGPDLTLKIHPHIDQAMAQMSLAAAEVMAEDKDIRDLFAYFCEMLSDANNVMETLGTRPK